MPGFFYFKDMKHIAILIYSFIFLTAIAQCKEKDWREDPNFQNAEIQTKLLESKTFILNKRKEKYELTKSFSSKEEAVKKILEETKSFTVISKTYITWEDQIENIFPNTFGLGTVLDQTPIEDYKILLNEREKVAIQTIHNLISDGYTIDNIEWDPPRRLGLIMGHKPKVMITTAKGKKEITQIKMVYEVNGRFIVGVLGP